MGAHAEASGLDPGWYPDPDGETVYRYHDGEWWTDRTMDVPSSHRDRFIAQRKTMRYHGVSDFGDVTVPTLGAGAKAAIAVGVLLAVALVAALVLG